MATAAVLPSIEPAMPQTPASYLRMPFALPSPRFVGVLACQRDPLMRALETRVIRCDPVKPVSSGKKKISKPVAEYEVELEDTVIFPEGGGQPSDLGTITSRDRPELRANVREALRVGLTAVHFSDAPFDSGERVSVEIDWPRRLDLMTQHLGQHLLSAVLEQHYAIETVSWALAAHPEPSYIEVNRVPTSEEIERVESLCNAHIRSDVPVHVEVFLPSETNPRPSTLPSDYLGGVIRVVHIGDLDANPCCGSHPPRLGLLQAIKVMPHTTSVRGSNARLYFAVGERILARYGEADHLLRSACAPLSCDATVLPERVLTLSENARSLFQREKRLRSRLAAIDAQIICESGDTVVLRNEPDDDAEYLGLIASSLCEQGITRTVVLAAQPTPGNADGCIVVCGGDPQHIEGLGSNLRKTFAPRLKGGGKGRYQGKLAGRWSEADVTTLKSLA